MPVRTQHSLESLHDDISKIFQQLQISTANHQKNVIALSKIQLEVATVKVLDNKKTRYKGEEAFADEFMQMIMRILQVKKGNNVVDRVVKFIGGYIEFLSKKDGESTDSNVEEASSPTSRFIEHLLESLSRGLKAKDKNIRYRVLQVIAEITSNLAELDADIYESLRTQIEMRLQDKEPSVRVQAISAICKLTSSDGDNSQSEYLQELSSILEDIAIYDEVAEVRKAALVNLTFGPSTIPTILSRTRDEDQGIRRLVYSIVSNNSQDPKQLTTAQRELLIKNGLGDREPAVRLAASKLIADWMDQYDSILEFLKLFDLVENAAVAEEALFSVFETRQEVFQNQTFEDAFFENLTPEKAFLSKVFVEHCVKIKDENRLETSIPVVTALAFRIQALYNTLLQNAQTELADISDEGLEAKASHVANTEFIVGELLGLAVHLDYADEIGRRKVFALVRDIISQEVLPEKLLPRCLDILSKLCSGERDLIRIVVEVIQDLRDPGDIERDLEIRDNDDNLGNDSTDSAPRNIRKQREDMTLEQKERANEVDLRCLSLCIGMLERINSTFDENLTLEGILNELIIPAVVRKELELREKGLVSLGLCCMINRQLAFKSIQLFLNEVHKAPESIKIRVLQIIFDFMMVHENDFIRNPAVGGAKIIEFLSQLLRMEESAKVQGVLCLGLAKLLLSGMVRDEEVLKSLIYAYMSPATSDNQEVRQCLTYFFSVYCYTSSENQRRMKQIFMPVFDQLSRTYSDLDEDEDMITPAQVASMLVDWTDPQKAIEVKGQKVDWDIHLDLAVDIVKTLFDKDQDTSIKKTLCQLLGKLYMPDEVDDDKIRTLKLLLNNLRSRRSPRDTTAKNALVRFDTTISKKYESKLDGFNEDEFRQLENLKDLFDFLDDIIPEDSDEEVETTRKTRKRRSDSVVTSTTSNAEDEEYSAENASRVRRKAQAKRRKVSDSSTASTVSEQSASSSRRALPTRTSKTKRTYKDAKSDSDDGSATSVENSPRDETQMSGARGTIQPAGADDDSIFEGYVSSDSIMDSDEDSEEEEVDSLLV